MTFLEQVFGFVVAGHDTTSTTICWGLKYLAEDASAQETLRDALRAAYPEAIAEGRAPSVREITSKQIPYLNAVLEEILRCSGTVPIVDRQALIDTQLLGYNVPKGTVVSSLVTGPSLTSAAFPIDAQRRGVGGDSKSAAATRSWDPLDSFKFKPERWLASGSGDFDGAAGPQLAFGLGTRQCYGKRLAYLELKIVFTLVVWNFKLLQTPKELSGHHPVLVMTSRPKDCYVRLESL
jgi:cytochrome P450